MVVAQVAAQHTTDQEIPSSIPTESLTFLSSLLSPISLSVVRDEAKHLMREKMCEFEKMYTKLCCQ